jgi:hypothetical protein
MVYFEERVVPPVIRAKLNKCRSRSINPSIQYETIRKQVSEMPIYYK